MLRVLGSCSGRTVSHPSQCALWSPLAIYGLLLLTSDTSPSNQRPSSFTSHYTVHWWLNIPSAPVPSITNTLANALTHYWRVNYSDNTHHACPTFYFVLFTFLKCSKDSVQILLQSVISGLTLVTPISQSCMNIKVKKVRQFFSWRYTHL